MSKSVRTCHCVTLHTYPAIVTADSWHIVTHLCHCGREHFREAIPAPEMPTATRPPRRRANSTARRRLRRS